MIITIPKRQPAHLNRHLNKRNRRETSSHQEWHGLLGLLYIRARSSSSLNHWGTLL